MINTSNGITVKITATVIWLQHQDYYNNTLVNEMQTSINLSSSNYCNQLSSEYFYDYFYQLNILKVLALPNHALPNHQQLIEKCILLCLN